MLDKSTPLMVRWSNTIGFFVENVKILRCDSAEELQHVVNTCIKRRRTGI
jgi:hypothetical protein